MLAAAFKRSSVFMRPAQLVAYPRATFAINNDVKDLGSKEEKSYFSKQDAKLLKKLVEKMEARDAVEDAQAEEHCAVTDDLTAIFEQNNLQKDGKHSLLWQELMEWKRHKY